MSRASRFLQLALCLGLASFATTARAQATIQIMLNDHLSRPTDGKVTVKGKKTFTCTTMAGKCAVRAPKGKYTVTVEPRTAGVPKPRKVTVPSSGTARVAVSLPDPAKQKKKKASGTK